MHERTSIDVCMPLLKFDDEEVVNEVTITSSISCVLSALARM